MSVNLDPFIRKLRARHALSGEEESALRDLSFTHRRFSRNDVLVRAGEKLDKSMLLLSGFSVREKIAGNGARQIVEINVAGDFIDLHGFILGSLDHEIRASSRIEIASVPHSELKRLTERHPRLSRALWFQTLVDASIHREWMLVLGKKRGRDRIAQFFCEMHVRLDVAGLLEGDSFPLPFTQQELGDITGMTSVHLNRCLKELRDAGLVTFRGGQVEIHDRQGLERNAQFDRGYLHLGPHDI